MKSPVHYFPPAARILMGLIFLTTGLNGFFYFLPMPETPLPEGAVAFMEALMRTGYMFPLIVGAQLIVGILLLINRFVPLALALIAPIIVGIVSFHLFLEPSGWLMAAIVFILEIYLTFVYRDAFRPILAPRHVPR